MRRRARRASAKESPTSIPPYDESNWRDEEPMSRAHCSRKDSCLAWLQPSIRMMQTSITVLSTPRIHWLWTPAIFSASDFEKAGKAKSPISDETLLRSVIQVTHYASSKESSHTDCSFCKLLGKNLQVEEKNSRKEWTERLVTEKSSWERKKENTPRGHREHQTPLGYTNWTKFVPKCPRECYRF